MKSYLIGLMILIAGLVINRTLISMGIVFYLEVSMLVLAIIIVTIYMKTSQDEITSKDVRKMWLVIFIGLVVLQVSSNLILSGEYFSLGKAIFTSIISGLVTSLITYIGLIIPLSFAKKHVPQPIEEDTGPMQQQ